RENFKSQAPSSKEAPNFKLQRRADTVWNLELGVSLELGAWDLELLIPRYHSANAGLCLCPDATVSVSSRHCPLVRAEVWLPDGAPGTRLARDPVRRPHAHRRADRFGQNAGRVLRVARRFVPSRTQRRVEG